MVGFSNDRKEKTLNGQQCSRREGGVDEYRAKGW